MCVQECHESTRKSIWQVGGQQMLGVIQPHKHNWKMNELCPVIYMYDNVKIKPIILYAKKRTACFKKELRALLHLLR